MDGHLVYVVIVDDDDNTDAQVFQSEQDAQTYVVGLILDYLAAHPQRDHYTDEDAGEISWTDAITGLGDPPSQYDCAWDFLNTMSIDDFGGLIVKRHIHPLVWKEAA